MTTNNKQRLYNFLVEKSEQRTEINELTGVDIFPSTEIPPEVFDIVYDDLVAPMLRYIGRSSDILPEAVINSVS